MAPWPLCVHDLKLSAAHGFLSAGGKQVAIPVGVSGSGSRPIQLVAGSSTSTTQSQLKATALQIQGMTTPATKSLQSLRTTLSSLPKPLYSDDIVLGSRGLPCRGVLAGQPAGGPVRLSSLQQQLAQASTTSLLHGQQGQSLSLSLSLGRVSNDSR